MDNGSLYTLINTEDTSLIKYTLIMAKSIKRVWDNKPEEERKAFFGGSYTFIQQFMIDFENEPLVDDLLERFDTLEEVDTQSEGRGK